MGYSRKMLKNHIIDKVRDFFSMRERLNKNYDENIIKPKNTPFGFQLCGNPIMENGNFEVEEVKIVQDFLPISDVFINSGANIGYYCCIALKNGKKVIAFEPMESNLSFLYKNILANNWDRDIEIYPIALGNQIGLIEIFGKGTGASLIKGWANAPDNETKTVPISTLDITLGNRFEGKQCFILVDIEGSEYNMLLGAQLLLNLNPKPFWLIEISIEEHWPNEIMINPNLLETFKIFWDNGYESWTADNNCRLINIDEINQIILSKSNSILTHNFIFIEKGKKEELNKIL